MKITKNQSKNALNWFLKFVKAVGAVKPTMAKHNLRGYANSKEQTFIGDVFLFCDRRYKDAKDYPDLFPVVIPVRVYGDGFFGINVHMIDSETRLMLLKKLLSFKAKYTDEAYSQVSFKLLRTISKIKSFEDAVQFYPAASVKSDFIRIPTTDWLRLFALPLHVKPDEK